MNNGWRQHFSRGTSTGNEPLKLHRLNRTQMQHQNDSKCTPMYCENQEVEQTTIDRGFRILTIFNNSNERFIGSLLVLISGTGFFGSEWEGAILSNDGYIKEMLLNNLKPC